MILNRMPNSPESFFMLCDEGKEEGWTKISFRGCGPTNLNCVAVNKAAFCQHPQALAISIQEIYSTVYVY